MADISIDMLEEMFAGVRANTPWNIDGDMRWGYFFTDPDQAALERAAEELQQLGYRFVELYQPEEDGEPEPFFFLHVEKVETRSVASLDERNSQLNALATRLGLESYDGMDVGPAPAAG